jgi:hypothetical protein
VFWYSVNHLVFIIVETDFPTRIPSPPPRGQRPHFFIEARFRMPATQRYVTGIHLVLITILISFLVRLAGCDAIIRSAAPSRALQEKQPQHIRSRQVQEDRIYKECVFDPEIPHYKKTAQNCWDADRPDRNPQWTSPFENTTYFIVCHPKSNCKGISIDSLGVYTVGPGMPLAIRQECPSLSCTGPPLVKPPTRGLSAV